MAKGPHIKRKKIFVSGEIQGRLTLRIGLYWIVYHLVLWHGLFTFRYLQLAFGGTGARMSLEAFYREFFWENYPIAVCAAAMLPVFLFDLVRLTHRIAGPLVQIQRTLRQMTTGDPVKKVRMRRGDFLRELEQTFNEYVETYQARQEQMTADYHSGENVSEDEHRVLNQILELRHALEETDPEPAREEQPSLKE